MLRIIVKALIVYEFLNTIYNLFFIDSMFSAKLNKR